MTVYIREKVIKEAIYVEIVLFILILHVADMRYESFNEVHAEYVFFIEDMYDENSNQFESQKR